MPLLDGVVLGDAMVRAGLASVGRLRAAARAATGQRAARVRIVADLVRSRVDSPQETRLRLLLLLGGIPELEVGHRLVVARRERALDLSRPERLVAVEYDGAHHRPGSRQWRDDIERLEQLRDAGWIVVVVIAEMMWEPEQVIERVRGALLQRGAVLGPVDETWRRHFSSRRPLAM